MLRHGVAEHTAVLPGVNNPGLQVHIEGECWGKEHEAEDDQQHVDIADTPGHQVARPGRGTPHRALLKSLLIVAQKSAAGSARFSGHAGIVGGHGGCVL